MQSTSRQLEKMSLDTAGRMQLIRGMWIWNTAQLLNNSTQINHLIGSARAANVTDLYLYVPPTMYGQQSQGLASFNTKVSQSAMRVWALDGDRAYISSFASAEPFMDGLRGLVQFNSEVKPAAQFHGFQSDIEPQDTAAYPNYFYNGLPESKLNSTQASQRDIILHKWVDIHTRASNFLRSYDLPYGAAMPFWLQNYEGEPVTVSWAGLNASRPCVMDLIMPLVDEYVVMSYNTDPANVASRIVGQAKYASQRSGRGNATMPKVLGSLETAKGVGVNVSYGDTPGKESKAAVLRDLVTVEGMLAQYSAFAGMAIHHWTAWDALPS